MRAKKIVGKTIYLSPINKDDMPYYYEWMSNGLITNNIGRSDTITTEESNKKWFDEAIAAKKYIFTIVKDDTPIGCCGINDINYTHRTCELYIYLGEQKNRGKGYGKESLQLLIDYAFNTLNINNIQLKVFSFNEAALGLYKKIGFHIIGNRRNSYYLNGKYYDIILLDLLKSEWVPKE